MPETQEQANQRRREEAARLARRYASLQDIVHLQVSRTGSSTEALANSTTDTRQWMRSLLGQLRGAYYDPGEHIRDPFVQYLVESFGFLKENSEDVLRRYTGPLTLRNSRDWAAAACCIVNAVYMTAGRPEGMHSQMMALERSEFVRWLRVFREMLMIVRNLHGGASFELSLGVLAIDISGRIQQAIDSALVGPLVAAMISMEWATTKIGQRVSMAIQKTRCLPIIELWATVLNWLYNERSGFMRRARGFMTSVLVHLDRNLRYGLMAAGENIDGRVNPQEIVTRERIQALIDVIDTLLLGTNLLTECRLMDPRTHGEQEPRDPLTTTLPVDTEDPSSPTPQDTFGIQGVDPLDPSIDPTRQFDTIRHDPTDPATYESPSYIRPQDIPQGDWVFLTPANIELLLRQHFGADAIQASRVATGQACRDSLSPETETLLVQLGVLQS